MSARICLTFTLIMALSAGVWSSNSLAQETPAAINRPKRLLLLGQKPDSHPKSTHEYMAGQRIIARCLQNQASIQVIVVQADNPWSEGPELLDGADGAVLFLSEGAKWVSGEPSRLAAFQRLAKRGGALTCLHWGMGTKEAAPTENFVALFGGCHGGPDRKYKYGDFPVALGPSQHAIIAGIQPFETHDEFYYDLKFPVAPDGHTKLLFATIDQMSFPVCWAWDRPDRGRSFGFSGLHFHDNWKRLEYRRVIIQGVLWTLGQSIPPTGLTLDLAETDLALPEISP